LRWKAQRAHPHHILPKHPHQNNNTPTIIAMKKLILIVLPAFFFLGCAQEPPPQSGLKPRPAAKKQPADTPENFRAVEKPSSYSQ